MRKLRVQLDTSPLASDHAIRGIGSYTKGLYSALSKHVEIDVIDSNQTTHQKPDIVHYPYFDLFFPTLKKTQNTPFVVTVHDVIPLLFPDHYRPGLRGKFHFFRQKQALRAASAVITDSEASKKDIVTYLNIPSEKVHVTYLAAKETLSQPAAKQTASVLSKLNLPKKYCLYVGDINYNKNIPNLIKSLQDIPDEYHLVLLGKNFTQQDIPEWQAIAQQLTNFQKRIHILSRVESDDQLAAVYAGAAVYVQPSLYEGFGLPVLEAMKCGTVVVSTRLGSLPEVAGPECIYADHPSPEGLATAISQAFSLTAEQRKQKILALQNWEKQFTWKSTAQKTIAVYQRVLEK